MFRLLQVLVIAIIIIMVLFNLGLLSDKGEDLYHNGQELIGKASDIQIGGKSLQDYSVRDIAELTKSEIKALKESYASIGLPLEIREDLTDSDVYEKYTNILNVLKIELVLPKTSNAIIIKKNGEGDIIFEEIDE